MHRTEGAGATADHKFTNGNPSTGVAATEVDDNWLNAMQEEICSVIAAAGITLETASTETFDQLLAALKALFLGPGGTSTTSDYISIPYRDKTSGVLRTLLVQWGTLNPGSTASGTVTFPLAFPNACFVAVPWDVASSGTDMNWVKFNIPTATNVAWFAQQFGGGTPTINTWSWLAIGY